LGSCVRDKIFLISALPMEGSLGVSAWTWPVSSCLLEIKHLHSGAKGVGESRKGFASFERVLSLTLVG